MTLFAMANRFNIFVLVGIIKHGSILPEFIPFVNNLVIPLCYLN
jgi:hypothetical protein